MWSNWQVLSQLELTREKKFKIKNAHKPVYALHITFNMRLENRTCCICSAEYLLDKGTVHQVPCKFCKVYGQRSAAAVFWLQDR